MTLASPSPAMDAAALKVEAARAALGHVGSGMRLGIGTGSTAEAFVRLLAERVEGGLKVIGVPTSERTAALCLKLGVPLSSLEETPELDLTIDGADEVDGRPLADQGRRRRAAARKDRGGCLEAHDRHCRPLEAGGDARPLSRCRSRSTVSASRRPNWRSAAPRPRSALPARLTLRTCATARLSSQMADI